MRVLYLTEEAISFTEPLVRGGAIHVRNVVRGLRERGHDVVLLDWNDSPERPFQRSVDPWTRFVDGPMRTFREALTVARREDVDVIVSKTRKTYLPGLLAARATGVPHVVHVGSLPEVTGTGIIDRLDNASFTARLLAPHDAYFVVCEPIATALTDRGVDPSRIYNVGNAVDVEAFHPEVRTDPPAVLERAIAARRDEFLVGFVGGLHWYKGLSDLATALERCGVDAVAIIAGDGPERERLEREFGERGVFLGAVPYESVPAVYHAVDALVLPSYTEGLPRTILEAQATGTPVVCTSVGGVPDIVSDGETGLLCEPHDPDCLARSIDRLANDHDEYARLGTGGRLSVVESWSWDGMYDRYERFLEEQLP